MKINTSIVENDEIDLVAFFKIFWKNKISILLIVIISFLIGYGYSYQKPNNYLNSMVVSKKNNFELSKFFRIRSMMELDPSDGEEVLNQFINELEDYQEFIFNIKKTEKIKQNISKLTIENQEKALFKYARLLEIKKLNGNYVLNFTWHDPNEAKNILQDTLNLASNNLRKNIIDELDDSLEFEKKVKLNSLNIKLDFLKEQSSIAKELNIENNQIDKFGVSNSDVLINITSSDTEYYLKGHKVIDKKINIIQNRKRDNDLEFKEKELADFKSKKIDFVGYNVYLMKTKSLKNDKLIQKISVLLGLIIGVFYVLLSNISQFQTASKKN